MEESSKIVHSQTYDGLKQSDVYSDTQLDKHIKPSVVESGMPEYVHNCSSRLDALEEESEDETTITDSGIGQSVGNGTIGFAKLNINLFGLQKGDLILTVSEGFCCMVIDKILDRAFRKIISSTEISRFWKAVSDFGGKNPSIPSSQYLANFEELQPLGKCKPFPGCSISTLYDTARLGVKPESLKVLLVPHGVPKLA